MAQDVASGGRHGEFGGVHGGMKVMDKVAGHALGGVLPALALGVFSIFWTGSSVMAPRPGEPVAAIFLPWVSSDAAFAATASANADTILGNGGWPNVVIAQSNDPDFARHVRRLGAIVVLRAEMTFDCMR